MGGGEGVIEREFQGVDLDMKERGEGAQNSTQRFDFDLLFPRS